MGSKTLPYLDAVIKEILRISSILPQLSRKARYDTVIPLQIPIRTVSGQVISSIPIRAGQTIHMPVRDGLNTSPHFWGQDAKVWNPDRWINGDLRDKDNLKAVGAPNHFLTFGDGKRICLGRFFAVYQMKLLLATLLQNFSFALPPSPDDRDIVFYLNGPTLKPKLKGKEKEASKMPLLVKLLDVDEGPGK